MKTEVIFKFIIISLIVGSLGGGAYFFKKLDNPDFSKKVENKISNTIQNSIVDDSFFNSRTGYREEEKGVGQFIDPRIEELENKLSEYDNNFRSQQMEIESLKKMQSDKTLAEIRAAEDRRKVEEQLKKRKKAFLFVSFDSDTSSVEKADRFDENEPRVDSSDPTNLKWTLTTDKIIPILLQTPVNSELSGQIIAMVEEDVYATEGDKILIPAGSKATGKYEGAKEHSRRIALVWERIITPEGISIRFPGMGLDKVGYVGASTETDSRIKERYGASVLVSLVNALAQISVNVSNASQLAAAQSLGREASNLTSTILKENINIEPIILIRSGERLNIVIQSDIWISAPNEKNESQVTIKSEEL